MSDRDANDRNKEAAECRFTRLGPLDQLDWLIILLAVLLGTLAKQHHVLDLPAWFLDWLLPFLLIIAGYKTRRRIAEATERRQKGQRTREK